MRIRIALQTETLMTEHWLLLHRFTVRLSGCFSSAKLLNARRISRCVADLVTPNN